MRTKKQIEERIAALEVRRRILLEYLGSEVSEAGWHGVADAANDLREVDAELHALRWVLEGG